jgi:ATP10 protein
MQDLINTPFPSLKVKTLSGVTYDLPLVGTNKPMIVCLVFQGGAQYLVDTWTNPILKQYPSGQVSYLEIPMIVGGYGLFSGVIDGGMRAGIAPLLHDYVATYYGNVSKYKRNLMMIQDSSCYVFLINQQGIITYTTQGAATDESIKGLFGAVDELM